MMIIISKLTMILTIISFSWSLDAAQVKFAGRINFFSLKDLADLELITAKQIPSLEDSCRIRDQVLAEHSGKAGGEAIPTFELSHCDCVGCKQVVELRVPLANSCYELLDLSKEITHYTSLGPGKFFQDLKFLLLLSEKKPLNFKITFIDLVFNKQFSRGLKTLIEGAVNVPTRIKRMEKRRPKFWKNWLKEGLKDVLLPMMQMVEILNHLGNNVEIELFGSVGELLVRGIPKSDLLVSTGFTAGGGGGNPMKQEWNALVQGHANQSFVAGALDFLAGMKFICNEEDQNKVGSGLKSIIFNVDGYFPEVKIKNK